MTPPPRVSCIISTYNRRERLLRAIESVRAQEGVPIEILVCDDGSSDGTEEAVRSIDDPRIRFVAGPHTGLSGVVRNRGIAIARGEWLAFLDDDDLWRPGKLRAQLDAVARAGKLAACTNAECIANGRVMERSYHEGLPDRACFDFGTLVGANNVIISSAMIHRSLLPQVSGFSNSRRFRTAEDYALWLRVATLTDFVYLDDRLVVYTADSVDSVRIGTDPRIQIFRVLIDYICWAVRTRRNVRFAVGAGTELAKLVFGYVTGPIRRRINPSRPARVERAPYIRIPDFLSADEKRQILDDSPVDFATRILEILPDILENLGLDPLPDAAVGQPSPIDGRDDDRKPHPDNGTPATANRVLTYVYDLDGGPRRAGGGLRLYDTRVDGAARSVAASFVDLKPADNTLILFPSRLFYTILPADRPSAAHADGRFAIIGRVRDAARSVPEAP